MQGRGQGYRFRDFRNIQDVKFGGSVQNQIFLLFVCNILEWNEIIGVIRLRLKIGDLSFQLGGGRVVFLVFWENEFKVNQDGCLKGLVIFVMFLQC